MLPFSPKSFFFRGQKNDDILNFFLLILFFDPFSSKLPGDLGGKLNKIYREYPYESGIALSIDQRYAQILMCF